MNVYLRPRENYMKKILLGCCLCLASAFCFAMQDYEKKSECKLNYDEYKGKQPEKLKPIKITTPDKKKKNNSSN